MDGKQLIIFVETWVYFILALVAFGLEAWAFFDCLRHKANAFEAVSKRTKTFWLALTGGAVAIGGLSLYGGGGGGFGTLGLFGLAAVTAASVYLADVRPAVKDAGRGGSRNMGPYGPW
ncbi:hypothetical protein JOE40_003882 [Arthrobacter sp. PvP102]|uniref:DUF2516 family protein n=1 Tax=unclassified Arthrobacter TaxID=235627 RepID=UPI0000527950|nr:MULTISPECIES: DUF2516 family protein [unclassified Arthrobacter]ABK02117.1 hypothetical protein Arth_0719 [Arthrobacter sp. FB24]KIS28764.1 membrane protein [Arthrobacter sp. SPG23]MBP1234239.1 hypothetical protein [Arthrobacter sp. PvP103]MBP1239373.1 hypothetical protein [Arthrobacter sp. PvP102]